MAGQSTSRLITPFLSAHIVNSFFFPSFSLFSFVNVLFFTVSFVNFLIIGSLYGCLSLVSKMIPFVFSCFFSHWPYIGLPGNILLVNFTLFCNKTESLGMHIIVFSPVLIALIEFSR